LMWHASRTAGAPFASRPPSRTSRRRAFPTLARCPLPSYPQPSSLSLLDVSRNGICRDGAFAIADMLQSPRCRLTDLLVAHNPLSPDGCAAIAASLKTACTAATSGPGWGVQTVFSVHTHPPPSHACVVSPPSPPPPHTHIAARMLPSVPSRATPWGPLSPAEHPTRVPRNRPVLPASTPPPPPHPIVLALTASLAVPGSGPSSVHPHGFVLRYLDVTGVDMGRLGEDALSSAATDILDCRGSEVGAAPQGLSSPNDPLVWS
jgi:hypothetical protein